MSAVGSSCVVPSAMVMTIVHDWAMQSDKCKMKNDKISTILFIVLCLLSYTIAWGCAG